MSTTTTTTVQTKTALKRKSPTKGGAASAASLTVDEVRQRAALRKAISGGLPKGALPPLPTPLKSPDVPHAPRRTCNPPLSEQEFKLCVRNALRYFPPSQHAVLAVEFAAELRDGEWPQPNAPC
jgi:hypothetical protein